MPNAQKVAKVREIAEQLSSAEAAVLAGYRGLTVQEAAELRSALAEVDTRFSVVKNSLTRLAVKEAGLDALGELVDGPMAIAYARGDPVLAAKRLVEQGRRFPVLEILGGVAEGRVLTADQIRRFAELDSRDVMLAKLAGMAKGQIARTAWMLQALQSRFVLLMQALKEKLPAESPADEASASGETVGPSPVTRGVPSDGPPGPSDDGEAEASPEGAPLATEGEADASGESEADRPAEQADETKEEGGE